jgi:hypothetical protein
MCIVNLVAMLKLSVRFPPQTPRIFLLTTSPLALIAIYIVYFQSAHSAPFVRVTDRPRMPTHFELEGNIINPLVVGK